MVINDKSVYISKSETETEAIAEKLAFYLKPGDVLALYGEMGAGKTAFVRGLIRRLMPECLPLVHSPTFAIVNEYQGEKLEIFHFDFYRLKDEDDLLSIGFYDYFDRNGIIITEWSELFEKAFPDNKKTVRIEIDGEEGRRIYADFGD